MDTNQKISMNFDNIGVTYARICARKRHLIRRFRLLSIGVMYATRYVHE